MELELPRDFILRNLKTLQSPPFNLENMKGRLQFRESFPLDIRRLDTAGLEELVKMFEEWGEKAAEVFAKDIRFWIKARQPDGLNTARARKCHNGHALLVEYVRRLPHKHIYRREADGNLGSLMCYYVDEIVYHAAIRRKDEHRAAYVEISLVYQEFGVDCTTTINMNEAAVVGRNVVEMFAEYNLLPETPELWEEYQKTHAEYLRIKDGVGVQYNATAIGFMGGVDGNPETGRWRFGRGDGDEVFLGTPDNPTPVVVDIFRETDDRDGYPRDRGYNKTFWRYQITNTEDGELVWEEDGVGEYDATPEDLEAIIVPVHPFVVCFALKKHRRMKIHTGNLTPYVYDKAIKEKLVLPERSSRLIDTLLNDSNCSFKDVVKGKSGGVIVIGQGPPGTGKTLTAEVYAEFMERPLYTIQCAQLGTDCDALETNLLQCLSRGNRWGAVVLLDEADVYLQARGTDLQQNAVVGVFLRVLEYYGGVLFLTTNRLDLIDDAILSRCTARIMYGTPTKEDQIKIWKILCRENDLDIAPLELEKIVDLFPMAGREIKNVLKLCAMIAGQNHSEITAALMDEVKDFRPTGN